MGLLNFYKKTKKKLNDTFEPVAQKTSSSLGRIAREAREYLNNDATVGGITKNTFKPSNMAKSLMEAPKHNFADKISWMPKRNDSFGKRMINNPITKIGASMVQGAGNTFHSVRDYSKEATEQSYGVKPRDTKKLIGTGMTAALDMGGLLSGGKTGQELIKKGASNAKNAIWQGAKDTSKIMGRYGAGYSLADSLTKGDNVKDTVKNVAGGYAGGRVAGLAVGGGIPAIIKGSGQLAKEGKNIKTDIMNFKNPYVKRVANKVERVPNYGIMIHGKPQMVPVAGTERRVIEKVKVPFKPESFTGKLLNRQITINPGMTIKDVSKSKTSSGIMDFNNKIALKNKKAQETIAKQQQNQRLRLDKAEKGFVPPQRVKAPQKAVLEVKQSKKQALPSIEEYVNRKKEADVKKILDNQFASFGPDGPSATPSWITKRNNLRAQVAKKIADQDSRGKLPNIEEYVNIKSESPFKGDEFSAKSKQTIIKKDNRLETPEGGFNKFQERAYKAKGERVDAISGLINYPKELRSIGYVKKEIDRIGKNEADRIIKLGKLGYPKNEIQKMDFDRMDLILKREVPYLSLKNYYKKKHELDTNYLDGINPNKLKDISAPMTGWRDMYRNFETVFGDDFPKIKNQLLDPFDAAKGEFINEQKILLGELEENIVKKLGIKKGSDADKAVVLFGEGKLGEQELMQKFPKQWRNIVEADKWFKTKYPQLLKELNQVREVFFPTHPLYPESTKIIPERTDYYRHGKDLEGIAGLKNLFEGPSSIDPALAASSDVTNPKTKWASFTQKRKGEENDFGAVEGYLDYLKNYTYAKHIDPFISKFKGVDEEIKGDLPVGKFIHESRGLAEELSQKLDPIQQIMDSTDIAHIKSILTEHGVSESQADWMGKDLANLNNYGKVKSYIQSKTAKNKENVLAKMDPKALAENSEGKLNNFLVFIKNFSRDLGGKTNPIDRPFQENLFGRKALNIISWANSRFKANAVLGNASSSLAQFFNIPQGLQSAGPINSSKAIGRSLAGIFKENGPIKQSSFINERYFNDYSRFDEGILADTKKFAIWMTGIGDKIGTKFIWNAHYQKALSEGISNPIKYADDWTRKMVAGRGIGEVPIAQKSKIVQLSAPFQLEVANLWHAQRDIAKNDPRKLVIAGKMVEFAVASYLMNRAVKAVRGSDVSFDPMNAMFEAYSEYQDEDNKIKGSLKAGGRLAGEVISNIPFGQTAAGMYPEYGFGVDKESFPAIAEFMNIPRKELFGEGDPTRFGTGGLPVFSAIKNPLTGLATPYGGKQIEKTVGGIKTLMQGYSENKTGKVMTPVERNIPNIMRGVLFGKNATGEMQNYFDKKQAPLSDLQTEKFKLMDNDGNYFKSIMNERLAQNEKETFKKGLDKNLEELESGQLSDDIYQLSNGKFYSKSLNTEYETAEKAEREVVKEDFRKSDENFRNLGDRVLRKSEDGTISDISKTKFDTMLNSANLILLKKNENLEKWIETADKQFNALNEMLMDPSIDELEKVEIQSKLETLVDDYQKYSAYGGFTKPKKGKKLEEKYRYPLVDNEFLGINALLSGFKSKPRTIRRPVTFTRNRVTKVKRRKR